jgi:cell division septation protein DedD
MKKFIAPVVLFIVAAGLGAYLLMDFSAVRSSFDADAYLEARSRIDSLQVALFEAQGNPDLQLSIRTELEQSWESLSDLRKTSAPVAAENPLGVSSETMLWIAGGVVAVILCVILLFAVLAHRKKVLTMKMEAIKAAEEQRFKEPKGGLDDETIARPRPQKRSIIDEVNEYAARDKQEAAADKQELPKVAFEDENGVPENKILTTDLDAPRPQLRPTAKERITSAMQSLSDVLRSPRGVSRDRTMKIRAQSHNMTGDPTLQAKSPLKTSRFDREFSEKTKIMQMSRRGFPASAIASQLKIPQEQVEAVIKESLESGS